VNVYRDEFGVFRILLRNQKYDAILCRGFIHKRRIAFVANGINAAAVLVWGRLSEVLGEGRASR